MTTPEDLYEILQVHPSAHQDVIEAAYQRLAQLYHPTADPSPEAAAMLGAIARAYAVLGNPEKRAAYDQDRETVANATASQDGDALVETAQPKPRSRPRTGTSSLDYITIGSTKDDVTRVEGPPARTDSSAPIGFEGENWYYGQGTAESPSSVISFNKAGRVKGWTNQGELNVRIVPGPNVTTSETFSIGSHKDDVARLQGTPYRVTVPTPRTAAAIREERENRKFMREIDRDLGKPPNPEYSGPVGKFSEGEDPDLETWHFTGGIVEFSISTGRVTAWDNKDGTLKTRRSERDVEWTGEEYFTLGSSAVDIMKIQGKPTRKTKEPLGTEIWHYGSNSKVELHSLRVLGWSNFGGDLKVRVVPVATKVTLSPMFSLGSNKDDVARLQGTPRSVSAYRGYRGIGSWEFWNYGSARVDFSSTGRVIDWSNPGGELKVQGIRPDPEKARRLAEKLRREQSSAAQGCFSLLAALSLLALVALVPAFLV